MSQATKILDLLEDGEARTATQVAQALRNNSDSDFWSIKTSLSKLARLGHVTRRSIGRCTYYSRRGVV